ncbi:uncharacterized protein N7477_006678 [Penicillium maclennaniae]|uniref:uncharacterized protein n=1 Tax=Penicillium maclennaniae TaxID=1343394 RepID=UPI00253FB2F1|nr:uncharacterized protein N7477_006678 [Penicillium maclennaniae]KAJ5668108.1 hypothetical protein N7477_006678 [Penicillium maclennaniae]
MHELPVTTALLVIAVLLVAIRLWTRIRLIKSPGYDDLLVTLALAASIAFYAFILCERENGLGVSNKDLPLEVRKAQMRMLWLSVPFYNACLILCKLSVLILYRRIFHRRAFRIASYILIAFLIISGLWMVISGFVFCVPVDAFWSGRVLNTETQCLPVGPVWYANAGMQISSDIAILILPMPFLWGLHLPLRQRVSIMLIFGMGIFVIGTSSARLYELYRMINGHDFTKTNKHAATWSSLEANVSIICACLLPLWPFISRIFSFCFRPQPLHSSPATRQTSNTTQLTSVLHSSRKASFYGPGVGSDGGIFYNDFFYAGPGTYSASIAKTDHTETNMKDGDTGSDPDAIRVVRELRIGSDSVAPSPTLLSDQTQDRDFEAERSRGSGAGTWNASIEWDLGDFKFPDYKERMNAPI